MINRVRLPILWSAERGRCFSPSPRSRLRIWSRETGLTVPSRGSPLILNTQAESDWLIINHQSSIINHQSGAYSRDSSRFPRRRPHIYIPSTTIIGSVPSSSGHAISYRWRSLPRVRWHRASSSQGSSSNGCCLFKYYSNVCDFVLFCFFAAVVTCLLPAIQVYHR